MKIFSLIMAVILSLTAANVSAANKVHMVQEWRKVVRLSVPSKDGTMMMIASGFPIDNSAFLTAGHFCASVAEGVEMGILKEKVTITYLNQNNEVSTLEDAEIVKYEFSERQDLCVIIKPKHGIRPVTLAMDYDVRFGDKVYVVGAPHGFFPIVTDGYVAQPVTDSMPIDVLNGKLLTSAPASSGNSGGPVFNMRGEVIGLVVMVHPKYFHTSMAITVMDIWRFILGG